MCHKYALVYSLYSYVSSYLAHYFDVPGDSLDMHVYVSTPMSYYIMVDYIYQACVVTIRSYDTIVNLLLLSLADFDMSLGMD